MVRKYYFINKFETNNINKQDKQTTIIYRNYTTRKYDKNLILELKEFCKKKRIKFYLSNNVKLAIQLDLDGAYIPSFNKSFKNLNYSYKKKFEIIGSAHNLKEIRVKELQKVNKIFISSIFKKNKNFLGLNKFKILINHTNRKVIALGGIKNINIKRLKLVNCVGFAGISFFE